MIGHTLLLIYRNFKRFRSAFFINLIGLSAGMACTLLICLWILDEWRFDRYHTKDAYLFQVMEERTTEKGIETTGHTQHFLAEALRDEMPEVEHAVTVTPPFFFQNFTVSANETHVEGVGKYADKDYFKMFSHDLLYGRADGVLADKNSIVLSESMARRLFSDITGIVGMSLEYQVFTLKKSVTITGVYKDIRPHSFERFDFVLSFDAFRDIMRLDGNAANWDDTAPFFTYVTLKPGVNEIDFRSKLVGLLRQKSANASHRTLFLKRFSDNYLYGKYVDGIATGRIEYVKLFGLIAIFVQLIACVNFVNLSTAKALGRLKDIGIKKAIGAGRRTLVFQILGESVLMSFLSLAIAILIVDLLLPQFNSITGKDMSLSMDINIIASFAAIAVATGLLAGSYPALFLSGLNISSVLQGRFKTSPRDGLARKGLVIFQLGLSIVFIVGVVVVHRQIEFVQTKHLGFDRENVLCFETNGRAATFPESLLYEVKKLPGVINASSMLGDILAGRGDTQGGGMRGTHSWQGKDVVMNVAQVNYELIETLGIQIKDGRSFFRDHGPNKLQLIYNEAAIDALGIQDPVGQVMPNGAQIVGVAKNFNFQSLHEVVEPHCFMLAPDNASTVLLKIRPGMETKTIKSLEELYRSFNPGYEFEYRFLDDKYQQLYSSERRVARLSGYFAALAMLISCLGLFGLAAFTAERRTKEVGIRKALGASVTGIIYLLSSEFTRIILVAIVISLPASYLLALRWLESFAFRIPLEWWYFAGAGVIAVSVTWVTVSVQAFKAARLDPVRCLRDE